jgi:thiol-disulfide isomerase/thioredoxin
MEARRHFNGGATVRILVDIATFALLAVVAIRLFFPPSGQNVERQSSTATFGGIADSTLEAVNAKTVTGDSLTLFVRGDKPTLTFLFLTTCPACQATKPAWERLGRDAALNQIRVVAASPEQPVTGATFFTTALADSLKVVMGDGNGGGVLGALQTERVPTTVLTVGDRVLFHHVGLLSDGQIAALEATMRAAALGARVGGSLGEQGPAILSTSSRSNR